MDVIWEKAFKPVSETKTMSIVLITGGAGFIGSNIVGVLVKDGYSVKILDNFSSGTKENTHSIKGEIETIDADITDKDTVKKVMSGVDYVLHQAALPSVPRSIKDPVTTNAVNVDGTLNILNAARNSGVKRVVFASSSSVYGDNEAPLKSELLKPSPISPYGVSKLAGEYYCRVFYKVYGLETVCLRYFNVYGPNQNPDTQYAAVIPKFITSIMNDKPPTIYGDGKQSRDFTFVKDVVNANILAMKARGAAGKVFNIAAGKRTTINELVSILDNILGKDIVSEHTEPREGDIKHSLADISLAKKILGYEPKYTLEEGLKETVKWYELQKT